MRSAPARRPAGCSLPLPLHLPFSSCCSGSACLPPGSNNSCYCFGHSIPSLLGVGLKRKRWKRLCKRTGYVSEVAVKTEQHRWFGVEDPQNSAYRTQVVGRVWDSASFAPITCSMCTRWDDTHPCRHL